MGMAIKPMLWVPWAGLALLVPLYLAAFFAFQGHATTLILLLFFIQGVLCLCVNHWPPFLLLCATIYVFPNPTGSNVVVLLALGSAGVLTKSGLLASLPRTAIAKSSRASLMPLWLLLLGFATALPTAISGDSGERLGDTLFQVARLAIVFGALPFLCVRWISPRRIRLCISFIAAGLVIYYALSVFGLSGTSSVSSGELDSVQGELSVGARTLLLIRTCTGPTLAIGCCVLWGLLLTERRLAYKAAMVTLWALGSGAIMYTGARGAMVAEVFVCLCIAGLVSWRKRQSYILIMAVVLGVCLLLAVQVCLPQIWSVVAVRIDNTSLSWQDYSRIDRWLGAFEFFCSQPLGVGWTLAPLDRIEHAHNDMLIMAMSFGVFGLAAYIMAFGREWIFLVKRTLAPNDQVFEASLPSLACLMALFVCGFMDMMLAVGWIFDVAWLMVVLARANRPGEGKVP
jgi:hypothetical protein